VNFINPPSASPTIDGHDVVKGLTRQSKTLPAKYFYDDRGSQLFEQICELPEYYPTRTETAILQGCARSITNTTGSADLIELGSGSSTKTRILLDAYQALGQSFTYLPIDVSAGILKSTAQDLSVAYPDLNIHPLACTYEDGLEWLKNHHHAPKIISFLGSSLGNLNPVEQDVFFKKVTAAMHYGDYFLLGVDLHKSAKILEPAYDDAQCVTAAFNLNMLAHLNWRFDGNFDLTQFRHQAIYNQDLRRIEMYLRSIRSQSVQLQKLGLTVEFAPDETILTEVSCKFDLEAMSYPGGDRFQTWGLKPIKHWTDQQQWFGVFLLQFVD
jgi:L-histidine Nalpha-methyltransferase